MARRRLQGFSLIELVIGLSVLGLLAAVAAPYLSNGARAYNNTHAALYTVNNLRYTSERIARELRAIDNSGGVFAIATPVNTAGDSITFTKTDGVTVSLSAAPPLLQISYDTLPGGVFTLADQLSSLSFSYYRSDGLPASTTADVAYIEFEVVLDNGNRYAQRGRVALRNRS